MADVQTAIVQAALNTSTGTQDFTADLGGNTPKAAHFVLTYATANGTAAAHFGFSVSFTDGTREVCASATHKDAVGSTGTNRRLSNTKIVQMPVVGDFFNGIDCEADFSQWLTTADTGDGTTGVQINITNAPAAAYLLEVTLYAGDDLQAYAGVAALGNVNVATDVTAPGFQPQIVHAACTSGSVGASQDQSRISFGVAVDSGGVAQRALIVADNDGNSPSFPSAYLSTTGACGQCASGGLTWDAEIGSFDANGFSATPRTGNSNSDIIYLALDVGDASVWCGTVDAPTSTGSDWTETGPGFTPQLGMLGLSMHTAVDTIDTAGKGSTLGMSVFTPAAEFSNTAAIEDSQSTMDNQSLVDNQMINLPDDGGVQKFDISNPTLNSNGWTVANADIVAADGTTRKWWGFALEEAAAVGAALALAHIAGL